VCTPMGVYLYWGAVSSGGCSSCARQCGRSLRWFPSSKHAAFPQRSRPSRTGPAHRHEQQKDRRHEAEGKDSSQREAHLLHLQHITRYFRGGNTRIIFNDAFRIWLKLPRWTSRMFVTRNVPTFHAVWRNFIYQYKY